jgi:hypothetical protein
MNSDRVVSIIVFHAVSCSCVLAQTATSPTPSTNSGIEGVISIGPTYGGPLRPGAASSKPYAHMEFLVTGEKQIAGSFTTDAEGQFRISLPQGHYAVGTKRKSKLGGCGPFEVDVVARQMTKVEWSCDSGMR